MSRTEAQIIDFRSGLQDTVDEDGQPLGQWQKFYEMETRKNGARRRKGIYRVARAGSDDQRSLNLVAASSHYIAAPIDTRLIAEMGTQFTVEWLVTPDDAATAPFLYWGVTTDCMRIDTSSSKLRVVVTDTGDTETTLTSTNNLPTSTVACQLVRDGASLTLRMDDTEEDTATMSAANLLKTPVGDLRIGTDSGPTNHFDGKIDKFLVLATARSNNNSGRLRFPDPRADYVLADYDFDKTTDSHIIDRSRYGNHGLVVNGASTANSQAHQTVAGSVIHHYRTRSKEPRVVVVAGEQLYDGVI